MLASVWQAKRRGCYACSMLLRRQRSGSITRLPGSLAGEFAEYPFIGVPWLQQDVCVLEQSKIGGSKPSLYCQPFQRELFVREIAQQRYKLSIPLVERCWRNTQPGCSFLQAVVHTPPRHALHCYMLSVTSPELGPLGKTTAKPARSIPFPISVWHEYIRRVRSYS